jgi:Flp pilus assembly pilin Flp
MWFRRRKTKGQAITEYAVLLGIIVLALVLVQVYLKRSVQGRFKSNADDIGEQWTTGANYTLQTVQQSARNENSGVALAGTTLNQTWSRSEIQTSAIGVPNITATGVPMGVLTAYAGHEITQQDYVSGVSGADANPNLGAHGTFDSGVFSNRTLATEGD